MPPEAMGVNVEEAIDDPFGVIENALSSGYDGRKWDVYSLGVLFYTVWTRERPFSHLNNHQVLYAVSEQGVVPAPPWPSTGEEPPAYLDNLMQEMWARDPHDRPTMERVAHTLGDSAQQTAFDDISVDKNSNSAAADAVAAAAMVANPMQGDGKSRRLGSIYHGSQSSLWQRVVSPEGQPYFWNRQTDETAWEVPDEIS